MPTICLRIFLLYNLLYTFFLCLLPKKIKHYFPSSSTPQIADPPSLPKPPPPPRSSPMNHDDLRRVFQMFDRNGDGRVTKIELNDSLEKIGIFIPDRELTQMINKIDANRDGYVDIDEFRVLYQTIMDERDEEEDMVEAFQVFDQNRDGFITEEELRSVLASLGLKQGRTAEDCQRMIVKVDEDGDGMVNFMEFKRMMKGGGFATLDNQKND